MRILDRYILTSMIKIFINCILIFLLLYIIIDVFSHLDEILKQKTSIKLLSIYYLNFLPLIFVQIAPFACLLGCLYTLGMLNRNNEIIAMRTSGLSIFKITKSIIIFAGLVSVFIFMVNDKFVPQSEIIKEKVKKQMQQASKKTQGKAKEEIINLSIYGLKNRLFFINKFIVSENKMEGITILEQDKLTNVRRKIVARSALYKDGLWHFYNCVIYFFDENSRLTGRPIYSPEQLIDIVETPQDFLNQRQKPEFMSVAQLNDYIWKLSRSHAKAVVRNLKIDLFQRFFMPLTSLVIIFVGIPFSLMIRKRAAGLASLGIALMVGFLYYVVNAILIAFGKAGFLAPILAASSSHILFLSLGLYVIHKFS